MRHLKGIGREMYGLFDLVYAIFSHSLLHITLITFPSNNNSSQCRSSFEHVQVIRCDIKPGSVEKSRDVKNRMISEKIQRKLPLGHDFQTPHYFIEGITVVLEI
jgi:hypothetical protein